MEMLLTYCSMADCKLLPPTWITYIFVIVFLLSGYTFFRYLSFRFDRKYGKRK